MTIQQQRCNPPFIVEFDVSGGVDFEDIPDERCYDFGRANVGRMLEALFQTNWTNLENMEDIDSLTLSLE